MTEEEIEKQARERAEKLENHTNQTLGIYDNEEDLVRDEAWNDGKISGYEEGFIDGAKWGVEQICKTCEQRLEELGKPCAFRSLGNEYCWE